jgi:hypothetical protein
MPSEAHASEFGLRLLRASVDFFLRNELWPEQWPVHP